MSVVQNIFQTLTILKLVTSMVIGTPFPEGDLLKCLTPFQVSYVGKNLSSEQYNRLNYQWNSFNQIYPIAFVLPKTTNQVKSVLNCTRALNLSVVAKSGGHSFEKYSFGNGSAVVIDLQKLNSVKINQKQSTAIIRPGVLMHQLFPTIWRQGKFVPPGPVCAGVGFGGAALGGGHGWLSKKFGLLSDNLLEMTIVTAAGKVLKVNSQKNSDLFWALRGAGGGNFGIVTKFKTKIYSVTNFTYTNITLEYSLEDLKVVFDAYQNFCWENINMSVYIVGAVKSTGFRVTIMDVNLPSSKIEEILTKFPNTTMKTIETFSSFRDIVNHHTPWTPRYAKVQTYFVQKVVSTVVVTSLGKVLARIPPESKVGFKSYGGVINQESLEATAFCHRKAMYMIQVTIGSNNIATTEWIEDLQNVIDSLDSGESYQNLVDGSLPHYLDRYYGSNVKRLRDIKKKYDPTNYFRFPQSIPLS